MPQGNGTRVAESGATSDDFIRNRLDDRDKISEGLQQVTATGHVAVKIQGIASWNRRLIVSGAKDGGTVGLDPCAYWYSSKASRSRDYTEVKDIC